MGISKLEFCFIGAGVSPKPDAEFQKIINQFLRWDDFFLDLCS